MAVTKLWSVTERLGQVIDYATNPEKTSANIKRDLNSIRLLLMLLLMQRMKKKQSENFMLRVSTVMWRLPVTSS